MAVSYGTEQTGTVTSWNSLASGSRAGSAAIDNSSALHHAATLQIGVTPASAPAAGTQTVEVWIEGSTDGGTTFGSDSGVYLGSFQVTGASQVIAGMDTDQALAILPKTWRVVLVNRLNVALSGSGNTLKYLGKKAL